MQYPFLSPRPTSCIALYRNVLTYVLWWQALKDDLQKQQQNLIDSNALAESLLSASEDPVSDAELQSRISRAELDLKQLAEQIEERETQLQTALAQCGQFETDFDDFLRWLTKTERTVAKLRPISADVATVQDQKDSYQVGVNWCLTCLFVSFFKFQFNRQTPKNKI